MPVLKKHTGIIASQAEIAEGIFDMWILTDLTKYAKPGQFINVYPKNKATLLPRPISICETDLEQGKLRITYRTVGSGTLEFSNYQAGDGIDIMGTLGNGFPVEQAAGKKVILMGGGIGIPPLLELAKAIGDKNRITIIAGYRNQDLFLQKDLEQYGSFYVATEDGSVGTKGNVMNVLENHQIEADLIYACGPMPMLRAIKNYAEMKNIDAWISLEERMACGVGACLGCVVKTKHKDHHSHVNNARICADGPVFLAKEVDI
jgi:dihydroorotate dehydrogenase electron transfer subunit